jgi:hypothetical protein
MDDAIRKFNDYVDVLWKSKAEGALKAQRQLLGWLFTVHGAGIAGSLGYITSKGRQLPSEVGLAAFAAGLLALLLYGTLFYYFEAGRFEAYKRELRDLDAGKLTPLQFLSTQRQKRDKYRSCEIMAWVSGLCALTGLIALIAAVLRA